MSASDTLREVTDREIRMQRAERVWALFSALIAIESEHDSLRRAINAEQEYETWRRNYVGPAPSSF